MNPDDAGTDGGSDVNADSPNKDGGTDTGIDSSFDGGFLVETFDNVLGVEMCKALSRCCYGNPTPGDGGADGGNFDTSSCVKFFSDFGFEASNTGHELKDGGKVAVDQASADNCIKKIQGLSCNLAGADFEATRTACFGAYRGLVGAGGACKDAIECQQSFFCKGAEDGGAGVCTAIRPVNGPCGDFTSAPGVGESACSYRGGGDTGNFCKFGNVAGGVGTFIDAGDWKCTAQLPIGSGCGTSTWCAKSLCNTDSQCATPDKYFDRACEQFVKP